MRAQLALTLVVSAGLATLVHAQGSPGAAQTETVGGVQSIGAGGGAASPMFNPTEFPVKKDNGPHTGATPIDPPAARLPLTPLDTPKAKEPGKIELPNARAPQPAAQPYQGQPVQRYHLENAWPQKVEPAPKPVVQPRPTPPRTPIQAWPSKIDGITIKQGVRR